MRLHHFIVVAMCLVLAAAEARAQSEVDKLMAEISQLSAEQKQLPTKLQENLALKRANEAEYNRLKPEDTRLKSEGNAIEAQRPSVQSVCTGTVPQGQLAAAQARCKSAQDPFNRRVNDYNTNLNKLKAASAAIDAKENARVAAAKQLQARSEQITQRLTQLQAALKLAQRSACTKTCQSQSGEAAAQCLQSCFDGAANTTATVEQNQRPTFSATPNRTPEQAIEEYRRSGRANPGPNTLRTNPVPPPPPTSNR